MAGYNVTNGDLLQLDESIVGVIDFLSIEDGILEMTNVSDNGVVLEFASGGHVTIGAFGKLDIQGKMISIGSTDGSRGASVSHWQSEHPVNVIWVETASGSGEYKEWVAINPPLSDEVSFDNFADNEDTGRVFRWNNGSVEFSSTVSEASVPVSGADIMVPNIIVSTENPFNSIHLVEFSAHDSGEVNLSNVGFSDFGGVLDGMSKITISNSSFFGPVSVSNCDELSMNDAHITPRGSSGAGLSVSYCDGAILNNVTGISVYSTGVGLSYLKNLSSTLLKGISQLSDSDAILLSAIRDGEIAKLLSLGGALKTNNCIDCKIVEITLIDKLDLQEENSNSSYNLSSFGCSNISFITISIPDGGSANKSNIELYDNSNLDIVNTDIQSAFADDIVIGKGNFKTRISQMFFTVGSSDNPIDLDETNDGLFLHGITSLASIDFDVRAKNTLFKGVFASFIDTGNTAFNFAHIYSTDTDGKLLFTMAKDTTETIFSNASAGIRWGADNKVYFENIGDSVDIEVPYNLKGISLADAVPTLVGGNTSAITVEYALNHGSGYLPFKEYLSENIVAEQIVSSIGFMLKVRITATDVSIPTYVNSLELQTLDERFSYPLDYEVGKLQFDLTAAMDFNSKYFVYYSDGYGTAAGTLVRDADGTPITGHVPPNAVVDFTYDYIGDTSNGRVAGMPFDMIIVLGGSNIVENQIVEETFEAGMLNTFPIRTKKEYAYV